MILRRLSKLALPVTAFAVWLSCFSVATAQRSDLDREEREDARMQRKLEKLQTDGETRQRQLSEIKIELEKRLAAIEAYLNLGTWIIGGIGAVVLAQFGKGAVSMMADRKAAKDD